MKNICYALIFIRVEALLSCINTYEIWLPVLMCMQCGDCCFSFFIYISCSDSVAIENKMTTVGAGDGVSSSAQPTPGYQSAWMGVPGQVSMADIVKMGRPQNKASTMPSHQSVNHQHATAPPLAASHHDFHSSENHAPKVVEINTEPEIDVNQRVHSNDEWPSIEQPTTASASPVREVPADSEFYGDLSNLPLDRGSQHVKSQFDDVQSSEDAHDESFDANHVGPASVSTRNMQEDCSGGSSIFDNNMYGNINSYQSHRHTFENNEGEFNVLDSSIIFQLHSTIPFKIVTFPRMIFQSIENVQH